MTESYTADQVREVLGAVALEKLREHTTFSLAATHHAPMGRGTPRRPSWRTHAELEKLVDRTLDDTTLARLGKQCNKKYPTYYADWGAKCIKRHREDWDLDGAEQAMGDVVEQAETMVSTADIRRVSVAYDVPAEWLRKLVKAAGFSKAVKVGIKTLGYERPEDD